MVNVGSIRYVQFSKYQINKGGTSHFEGNLITVSDWPERRVPDARLQCHLVQNPCCVVCGSFQHGLFCIISSSNHATHSVRHIETSITTPVAEQYEISQFKLGPKKITH